MFEKIIDFIREIYDRPTGRIPLHEPRFIGKEKEYVVDAISSTYVSSVGEYVSRFENMMSEITGSKYAIATCNGTSALHTALILAGVKPGDEVITQAFTFVATANAITYAGAKPVFIDIDAENLGISPISIREFLEEKTMMKDNHCYNKKTGNRISACVPMHSFGFPMHIEELLLVCQEYNIPIVEDSAESIGSLYRNQQTGTFGLLGIFSFNGNKIVTCGGGGAIVTNDQTLANRAKHLTTTAKVDHEWEYKHDALGFNYRLPNLNAALACAQLEHLDNFIDQKRLLAKEYSSFFNDIDVHFIKEQPDSRANYWLNCILLRDRKERDNFLRISNKNGIMTRPGWEPMCNLDMYSDCERDNLEITMSIQDRLVNIPSSVII